MRTADDYRAPAQVRITGLLNGREERVHVYVHNPSMGIKPPPDSPLLRRREPGQSFGHEAVRLSRED